MVESKEKEMEFKDSNWVHVPGWVINHIGTTMTEAMVYATIYGFSQDGKSVFMGSASYLAGICKCTRPHMMTVLRNMVEAGYLKRTDKFIDGENRPCYAAIVPQGIDEKTPEGGEPTGETKSKVETKDSINPTVDSIPNEPKKARAKFVPPTREQVEAYCRENGLHFSIDKFFECYEKGNWHDTQGKPVKDWKGRCRSWHLRNFDNKSYGSTSKDKEQLAEISERREKDENDYGY